jgi:hypothetical protein
MVSATSSQPQLAVGGGCVSGHTREDSQRTVGCASERRQASVTASLPVRVGP